MTTHPSAETRARYMQGLLSADEFLEFDDHLAACAVCREAMAPPLSRALVSLHEGIEGQHLEYEQMEEYVDGTLAADDAAAAAAHLQSCAMCAEEVRDLRGAAERNLVPAWMLWAAAATMAIAILGAWAVFRPARTPDRVIPPVVVETQAPPVIPMEDPFARLSPSLRRTFDQLRAGVVPSASAIEALSAGRERIRGTPAIIPTLSVDTPIGVIEETRPSFRWTSSVPGAYVVEVFDASYRSAARSGSLRAEEWRPARPLMRGKTYSWQVTRDRGDERLTVPAPPEPPARFRIIDAAAAAELDAARAAGSHLQAALVCAREGILDRALAEMTLAQKERPGSQEIARCLRTLRNYQAEPTATNAPQ